MKLHKSFEIYFYLIIGSSNLVIGKFNFADIFFSLVCSFLGMALLKILMKDKMFDLKAISKQPKGGVIIAREEFECVVADIDEDERFMDIASASNIVKRKIILMFIPIPVYFIASKFGISNPVVLTLGIATLAITSMTHYKRMLLVPLFLNVIVALACIDHIFYAVCFILLPLLFLLFYLRSIDHEKIIMDDYKNVLADYAVLVFIGVTLSLVLNLELKTDKLKFKGIELASKFAQSVMKNTQSNIQLSNKNASKDVSLKQVEEMMNSIEKVNYEYLKLKSNQAYSEIEISSNGELSDVLAANRQMDRYQKDLAALHDRISNMNHEDYGGDEENIKNEIKKISTQLQEQIQQMQLLQKSMSDEFEKLVKENNLKDGFNKEQMEEFKNKIQNITQTQEDFIKNLEKNISTENESVPIQKKENKKNNENENVLSMMLDKIKNNFDKIKKVTIALVILFLILPFVKKKKVDGGLPVSHSKRSYKNILSELRRIMNAQEKNEIKVIRSYNFWREISQNYDFTNEVVPPPQIAAQKLMKEYPKLKEQLNHTTNSFNRVFYGRKPIENKSFSQYQKDLKIIFKQYLGKE